MHAGLRNTVEELRELARRYGLDTVREAVAELEREERGETEEEERT